MDYRQYLRSSERHLQVCKQLLGVFDTLTDKTKRTYLLAEIFYISGYVFESGLSYAFFSHIRYSGDVYASEHYKNKGFKTHSISSKYSYLLRHACVINDLVFVSTHHQNKELQALFNEWDVKYRYEQHPKVDRALVEMYIGEIEKGLKRIKTQYPY